MFLFLLPIKLTVKTNIFLYVIHVQQLKSIVNMAHANKKNAGIKRFIYYPILDIIAILAHGLCARLIALTLNGFGCITSPRS